MNPECEQILLRQFDSDCRDSAVLPSDVAQHLSACEACRHAWHEADSFDQTLQQALSETPSNRLYRRSYQAAIEEPTPVLNKWFWWRQGLLTLAAGASVFITLHWLIGFMLTLWLTSFIAVAVATLTFLCGLLLQLRESVE